MITPSSRRERLRLVVGPVLAAVALTLAGCGSGTHSATKVPAATEGTGSASLGALQLRGAYIPVPASPDVAAAYLSVTNTGTEDDVLTGVSTPLAMSVMAHNTIDVSDGAQEMVPLGRVDVPAHQTVAFTIGHRHLMLMSPQTLHQGERVPMTFTFARAGSVTVSVPVTAITGPQDGVQSGSPVPVVTAGPASPGMDMPGMGPTTSMNK